jgi:zinc protease
MVIGGVVMAVAIIGPVAKTQGAGAPKKVGAVEGISEYLLENGLRVLLFPDPTRPKVTVNLTVLVGSRHEGYGETGMAHLLEHMLFKPTDTHPDIPGEMKNRGADFNGSTSFDRTNYYETLPASDENLEFGIKLEADRMINNAIKADELAKEFSVVRNEFEMGENDPGSVLSQRMMAVAYEWHNYGKSTIGNRTDIERVPADNLKAFYQKFYQPDNAILVVAGAFDEAKALGYISKYFGSIPRPTRKLPLTYTEEPAQDGEREVTLRRVGDVGVVGLVYHVPAGSHPDFPAVEVLADILGDEPSGRLYKALVETKKATSISVGCQALHDPGTLEINAEVATKDLATLQKVRDAIISALEEVKKSGVTKEEVDRARQSFLKNRDLATSNSNRIAIELSEWAAQGDWRLYFLFRDRMEKVTPDQVKEVANKYLTTSNRTVGFFVPTTKPERTPIPAGPDIAKLLEGYKGREVKTAPKETLAVTPSAIEALIQRPAPIGGVKVALLQRKTRNESVRVRLSLYYGNEQNLKGYEEAADILGSLMLRGTKSLSRQRIQDSLDKNFARISEAGTTGILTFSVETKRANLSAVLEILRQVLREPTFPANEFDVIKNEGISALEQSRSDPTRQGFNRFQHLLSPYPKDDVRYVATIDERIERLKKTTVDQVRTLYRDYISANQGTLVVIGDFDPSEVLSTFGHTLDGWKSEKAYARIKRPYQPDITPKHETIASPDKENAVFLSGMTFPMGDADPDYPALVAGNFILGGGSLSSRIADRLRQKGGLSYSAQSAFNASPLDARASLMVMAIYNPVNVEKVVTGAREEVSRLLKDGVTPSELQLAKKGFLQQQMMTRTSDAMLMYQIAENLFIGRTLAFQDAVEQKIKALTPEAVNAALRKYVDPKRFSTVTAGDFQKGK